MRDRCAMTAAGRIWTGGLVERAYDDVEIRALWPGGLPDAEASLWMRLSRDRKERAVRRLKAILGLQATGDSPAQYRSVAEAASAAGTGVSTFYAIARRWRDRPSLASLGVHATSDGPGLRMDEEQRSGYDDHIRTALLANPRLTLHEIARPLGATITADPIYATIQRAFHRVRRELPPAHPFGEKVCFDSAGVDVVGDAGTGTVRLNAMVDSGTGLVLGWHFAPEDRLLNSYALAARRAWPRTGGRPAARRDYVMGEFDLAGIHASTEPPNIVVKVASDAVEASRAELAVGTPVFDKPNIGAVLVAALGERVGPVWMGSGRRDPGRSFRTGRMDAMPSLRGEVERAIDDAISSHNRARLDKMPRDASRDEAAARAERIATRAAALFDRR